MQEEGTLTLNMNAKNKITIPNVGGKLDYWLITFLLDL